MQQGPGRVAIASIRRVRTGSSEADQDLVAVEAPLAVEARQDGTPPRPIGVLMRTPGDDRELVLGLLYTEGLIRRLEDVRGIRVHPAGDRPDTAEVVLAGDVDLAGAERRVLTATSACGLCGRLSVDGLDGLAARAGPPAPPLRASVVAALPGVLTRSQAVFAETGGLHAAGLFDDTGALLALREDVGRHNAVDKIVGVALDAGWLPARGRLLAVSGRVAFEIVQKAVMAGVSAIVAVGAPSSLAIDAARAARLTLVGFARDGRFNVYAGPAPVADDDSAPVR